MKCLLDEMWRKIGAGFEMGYKKQCIDATGGLQKQEGRGISLGCAENFRCAVARLS
jgi:hypothetical protein